MWSYDFLALFQPSPPAEVAWQIFGGDAVEAVEPLLEAPAISIDVLDVQHLLVHMLTLAGDDELIFDAFGLGEGDQRLVAISLPSRTGRTAASERSGSTASI